MISYLPDETTKSFIYTLSYNELKEKYDEYVSLQDNEFKDKLAEILHFAIFICWFKELSTQYTCNDLGILHLLAHALHIPEDSKSDWKLLRDKFEQELKLS